jgi:hypothetical protein
VQKHQASHHPCSHSLLALQWSLSAPIFWTIQQILWSVQQEGLVTFLTLKGLALDMHHTSDHLQHNMTTDREGQSSSFATSRHTRSCRTPCAQLSPRPVTSDPLEWDPYLKAVRAPWVTPVWNQGWELQEKGTCETDRSMGTRETDCLSKL